MKVKLVYSVGGEGVSVVETLSDLGGQWRQSQ